MKVINNKPVQTEQPANNTNKAGQNSNTHFVVTTRNYNSFPNRVRTYLQTKNGKLVMSIVITGLILIITGFAIIAMLLEQNAKKEIKKKKEDEEVKLDETSIKGQFTMIEGNALISKGDINDSANATWIEAKKGDHVEESDSIKTTADSKTIIEFEDGSTIRMNSGSEIKIAHLSNAQIFIEQKTGEIYHRVGDNENREYIVQINEDAKFTALGTAFNTTVEESEDNQEINMICLESRVKASYQNTEKYIQEGKEFKITYSGSEGSTPISEISYIDGENLDNEWFKFNIELDKVRKAKLGIFENEEEPIFEITEPINLLETENEKITIKGTAGEGVSIKIKSIGEWETLAVENGTFSKEVDLSIGENNFSIKAYTQAGIKTEKELKIQRRTTAQNQNNAQQAPEFKIISLTSPEIGEIAISWKMTGYTAEEGFKIVFSRNSNPEFPNRAADYNYYVSTPSARTKTFTHTGLSDGGLFHFRVCRYSNGSCDIYSNDTTVTVQGQSWGEPVLNLNKSQNNRTITLNWTATGGNISLGYKIVWANTANPTYPQDQNSMLLKKTWNTIKGLFSSYVYATTNPGGDEELKDWNYIYISDSNIKSAVITLNAEEYSAGTWYFRVGRYRGGYCDVYSNQISVEIE